MSSLDVQIAKLKFKIDTLEKLQQHIDEINARLQEIANDSPVNDIEAGDYKEEFRTLKSELYALQNEVAELPVLKHELDELLS